MRVLVVHDNERTGQRRLSRIIHGEGSDDISPITWDGPEPVDLEAVEAIPGMTEEYLALTGRGIIHRQKATRRTATVVNCSPLPAIGEGDDFESFALAARNGKRVALGGPRWR